MKDRVRASRRDFTMLAASAAFGPTRSRMLARPPQEPDSHPVNADQALRELLAGNYRFTIGKRRSPRGRPEDFRSLANGQFPEAVIVSCADSRVAPEILFDVGVGDIFVVRVAGNVVNGAGVTVKGRIRCGRRTERPLILVLRHSGCAPSELPFTLRTETLPGAASKQSRLIKPAVASKECPATLENASAKTSRPGRSPDAGAYPGVRSQG
jgi:carbonic anhydrase